MHDTSGKPSPIATPTQTPPAPALDARAAQASGKADDEDETDVIGDLMGHYGKWQLLMTVLLSLFQVPNTFHISSSIYQAANKDFWCQRPAHLQQLPVDVWRNLTGDKNNCRWRAGVDWTRLSNDTLPAQLQVSSRCIPAASLLQISFSYSQQQQAAEAALPAGELIACSNWEYNTNDNLGNTWTSQWDLVCDKEYMKNVAEMFFLLGVATGGIISGYLSDKFGRKTMLFISAVLQTIFGK